MQKNQSPDFRGPAQSDAFLVVGIGASAGGIKALQSFFENVPVKTNIAYVVILHLSPDHDSQLAQILQAVSAIPVSQVLGKTELQPDQVYVVPPNQHLVITEGFIAPTPNVHVEEQRAPVDIFFRNLADTHGPRAICVILSGTGANGSMGLKRIKELGGVAFVQNPREAEFNEMPRNSIATELVDEVLPVAEIPARIIAYRESLGRVQIVADNQVRPELQQQALREIFTQLRTRTGHDFSNYKRPTLLRRIERRINIRTLPDLPAYAAYLRENNEESNALLKDLLISVTNFFRDPKPFLTLEEQVLPALFRNKKQEDQIRIWIPGCATGEEAYSIAMLCAEQTLDVIDAPRLQIFATDIDESAIAAARDGYYTINDAADVSPERLQRFFQQEGTGYRVRREIREMILFANHNFLKDPPFSRVNLISCRNVLIYLNTAAQERVMETFHFALNPGGYLFLGTSESVDTAIDLYEPFNREHRIFQSRQTLARPYPISQTSNTISPPAYIPAAADNKSESELRRPTTGELHQKLLEQYGPPSVVINEEYDILHLSEKAGRYLEVRGGEFSHNLLKLARPELRLELRSALYQAVQHKSPVEIKGVQLNIDAQLQTVNISVRPVFAENDAAKGVMLVLFQQDESTEQEKVRVSSDEPVARQLEEELNSVKAELKRAISHHALQAEELRASNEELQAMNEELRSSAEELETSKEELQSINEELRTVNQELKVKIEETSIAGNNIQNLINSTDVGTIFLDRNYRIKMFTPSVLEIFNLISSDYGRPITDITHKLGDIDLLQDAEIVMQKLLPIDREVITSAHRYYLMRLLPYRTADDSISGVVITFYEITKRRQTEQALQQSEERLRLLIESARDYAIITLDANRRVISWSVGAELMMGFSEPEMVSETGDIIFTDEDVKAGAPAIEIENAAKEGRAENEGWYKRKDGSCFWGSGSVSPLKDNEGTVIGFVKILRDLTEVRRLEAARYFLASVVETSNDSIITIDFERKITSWNKAAEAIYGYPASEAVGKSLDMLTLSEDFVAIRDNVDKVQKHRQVTVFDTVRVHKDGHALDLEIVMSPVLNASDEVVGISTIARDISKRKYREAQTAFLAEISRSLIDKATINNQQFDFTRQIGTFFDGRICVFSETKQLTDRRLLYQDWNLDTTRSSSAIESLLFRHSLMEFQTVLSTGHEVVVDNTATDLRIQSSEVYDNEGVKSFVMIPLTRADQWLCTLAVYVAYPRNWNNEELALLREIANRVWNSIERGRSEEDLRLSEIRFRTLTDAVPQVIWANDDKGVANYFNQRWFDYSGLTIDESYGKGWEAIVHPDDAPASKGKWLKAQVQGQVFDAEYRLRNNRGEYRWHIGRNVPLKDNMGQVIGWFGSATDIEELKRTEWLVRQTSDRLQLALDAGAFGSFEYDFLTGQITGTAQHAEILGYNEDEPFNIEKLKQMVVDEDREAMETELLTAVEQKRIYTFEYRIQTKGAQHRWIKAAGQTISDENGQPIKLVGITLDITEQKLFTEELSRRVAEQTLELQRSNEDLRQFAHVASHDLKEPVRKISTFNSRIQHEFSDILPATAKTYLAKIETAANRMFTMIDGVLAYSKLGNAQQVFLPVNLASIIQNIETDLEVMITAKNATVTKTKLPTITASEVLMYQLFYNLILNSLKFSKAGESARITISCASIVADGQTLWEITLADNGIGFEPAYASKIFNPFTRLNAGTEYEGTGLGLALCKKIVERHHGSISATGSPANGASFSILIPAS